jgi:hypothetical protein
MIRRVALLGALVLSLVATTSARAAAVVQYHGVDLVEPLGATAQAADAGLAQAHTLGANLVRVVVPWSELEPTSATPGPTALAQLDTFMNAAQAAGIKVIVTVDSTPCWTSAAPASVRGDCTTAQQRSAAEAYPTSDPATYAAVTALLLGRYAGQLVAYEVYNEPDFNKPLYFAGPNKPQRYAAILKAAYAAAKRTAPHVAVLAGALVGSNGSFLRALYAAGIRGHYDGISVHFYGVTLADLRATRAVQLAAGDHKPLWLVEFGWTNCYPRRIQNENACVTTQLQAANLGTTIGQLARASYVRAAALFELQDTTGLNFGLLDAAGQRKPAWTSVREAFAGNPSRPVAVKLHLQSSGGHTLLTGTGPGADFLVISAHQGRIVYSAQLVPDRFNGFSVALPAVLGTSGVQVSVYQQWQGARAAAHASL